MLSGGEKARLVMAKMLYDPPNFLVLDEPTNHLDMATKDMLITALAQYEGTMLFVSHDRHFLAALSNRVLELTPEGIHLYGGSYTAWALSGGVTAQVSATFERDDYLESTTDLSQTVAAANDDTVVFQSSNARVSVAETLSQIGTNQSTQIGHGTRAFHYASSGSYVVTSARLTATGLHSARTGRVPARA